jgi:glycosyltransferase involved in cell wall biosynthesis
MDVSVCLASYNGEKFILEQIDSILSQISNNSEVIVSDDGSCDRTVELVKGIRDKRVRLIQGPRRGLVKNFENALNHVSKDIIFLSDQDDIWLPHKVTEVSKKLTEFDLVISDAKVVDQNLALIHDSLLDFSGARSIRSISHILRNSFTGCCMAFNRKVLDYALPFPKYIVMHDWWIGLVACSFLRVCFLEQALILYRRHESNVSETAGKSSAGFIKKVHWRLVMISALLGRTLNRSLK